MLVQSDEQREAEIERRVQERVARALQQDNTLSAMIEGGVERAFRRVLSDENLRAEFWAQGYKELEQHAGTNVAQWLGRRIINIVITAAVAGMLAWFVMSGRFK